MYRHVLALRNIFKPASDPRFTEESWHGHSSSKQGALNNMARGARSNLPAPSTLAQEGPAKEKIYSEVWLEYSLITTYFVANYVYPTRDIAHLYCRKPLKAAPQRPQRANQARPRRRVVCTRAQGQVAHAATSGAQTIVVAPAKAVRYKNICASEPENVYTLLAASPTKPVCRYLRSFRVRSQYW